MSRITRDQLFNEICQSLSKRSACYRQNVGALITYQSRIVSTGWNGPAADQPHCAGHECPLKPSGGCASAIHAEINALNYCPRHLDNLVMYVSLSPCLDCAQKIVEYKTIYRVFYNQEYRLREGVDYLLNNNVEVYRITSAGHVIDVSTNKLI